MSILLECMAILMMIAIDQVSKVWAVSALGQGRDIKLIEGIFHLHYLENNGAAWGIFSGKQSFLILLTSVITIGMLVYLVRLPREEKSYRLALMLIISGAVGNLIDRVDLGYVRDFLYFKWIDFPIFNVADIFVVCGVILLMIVILFMDKSKEEEGK